MDGARRALPVKPADAVTVVVFGRGGGGVVWLTAVAATVR
jgi:hypothetical protein